MTSPVGLAPSPRRDSWCVGGELGARGWYVYVSLLIQSKVIQGTIRSFII